MNTYRPFPETKCGTPKVNLIPVDNPYKSWAETQGSKQDAVADASGISEASCGLEQHNGDIRPIRRHPQVREASSSSLDDFIDSLGDIEEERMLQHEETLYEMSGLIRRLLEGNRELRTRNACLREELSEMIESNADMLERLDEAQEMAEHENETYAHKKKKRRSGDQ